MGVRNCLKTPVKYLHRDFTDVSIWKDYMPNFLIFFLSFLVICTFKLRKANKVIWGHFWVKKLKIGAQGLSLRFHQIECCYTVRPRKNDTVPKRCHLTRPHVVGFDLIWLESTRMPRYDRNPNSYFYPTCLFQLLSDMLYIVYYPYNMDHIIYISLGSNIGIVQKIKLREASYLRWLLSDVRNLK